MAHGGRQERATGLPIKRPPDKYDAMYLARVKAGQYDDKTEHEARRPRQPRKPINDSSTIR